MDDTIYRVALVGCGTVSGNHLQALADLPQVRVCALCDIHPERAQAAKDKYGFDAEVYTDYSRMLTEAKPDAVHICTPHYLHTPMAVEALRRNIHVFLEKPMATSRDEIRALTAAEAESRGRLTVCFQNRFNPTTEAALRLCQEDGGVESAYGAVFWERNEAYYTGSEWRGRRATECGGVMINQAIHTIDLLTVFMGRPVSLCATAANHHLKGIIEVEDSCEGMIRFENGKYANFYATTAFHGTDSTEVFLLTRRGRKIEIRSPYILVDNQPLADFEVQKNFVGKECYGNGHRYLIARYYEALRTGAPMPVTAESAQYAHRILFAAYESRDRETEV